MSGDVQPRKRKDKKKKRDSLDRKSEGELVFSRKSSLQPEEDEVVHHGVHATKMLSDDIHLHVQSASSTGGNWCAKIFFFSLLAILVGLVGLIILENRGLSDLDTPLSESKYKEYFEGWVDEHRQTHNDPHDVINHEIEEHEEHDEPFEEEILEISEENDEEEDDEADDNHNENQSETAEEEADDDVNEENADSDVEDEETAESKIESEQQLGSVEEEEDVEEGDDEDNDDEDVSSPNPLENDDQEDEEESEQDDIVEKQIVKEDVKSNEASKTEYTDDDPFDEHDTNSNKIFSNSEYLNEELTEKQLQFKIENNTQSQNKEEYDTTLESLEDHIIENDNDEIRLLQEKAKLSQKNSQNVDDQEEESTTSNFAVKIVIGLALALVARLVLIKKDAEDEITKENVSADFPEPSSEIITQRRLTIAPDDLPYDEILDDDSYENDEKAYSESDEEEYIEEIIEIEIEDDQDDEIQNESELNSLLHESIRKNESSRLANFRKEKVKTPDIEEKTDEPITKKMEQQEQVPPANVKFQMTQATPNVISKPELSPPNLMYTSFPSEEKEKINSDEEDEIIEEEEIEEDILGEEEEEEEEDEDENDEMSDVDDSDLMARLEQKYGKIPFDADAAYESEEEDVEGQSWTNIKPKTGRQQYEDELAEASEEMAQNNFKSALKIYEKLVLNHPNIPEVHYGKAATLDKLSEIYKSNQMLSEAIESYKRFLAFGEIIENDIFNETANHCIKKMRFLGIYQQAVNIHNILIKRFPESSKCLNELVVTYMLSNSPHQAKIVLERLLKKWPNNGFAQVHYGFILKNSEKNLIDAVQYLQKGIESNADGTQDGRFYFHLGDALQRLGRETEALKIHKKGVEKKLFLSEYQRSLYNVENLKSKPFWNKIETTYDLFFIMLENNWINIRNEGLNILNEKGYFLDEAESLKDTGDWKQFELFARGVKNKQNCLKAPVTCNLIDAFPAARFCTRGQTKFSVMHANTHVWPHCGPTNCRIRAHLGLKVPGGTTIRVATEKRSWEEGKFLIFDDSFEHEVWHNGTDLRLVLIVDVWHPDLTEEQRNTLAPI